MYVCKGPFINNIDNTNPINVCVENIGYVTSIFMFRLFNRIITHAPVHINDFRGVRARYVKRTG